MSGKTISGLLVRDAVGNFFAVPEETLTACLIGPEDLKAAIEQWEKSMPEAEGQSSIRDIVRSHRSHFTVRSGGATMYGVRG